MRSKEYVSRFRTENVVHLLLKCEFVILQTDWGGHFACMCDQDTFWWWDVCERAQAVPYFRSLGGGSHVFHLLARLSGHSE